MCSLFNLLAFVSSSSINDGDDIDDDDYDNQVTLVDGLRIIFILITNIDINIYSPIPNNDDVDETADVVEDNYDNDDDDHDDMMTMRIMTIKRHLWVDLV